MRSPTKKDLVYGRWGNVVPQTSKTIVMAMNIADKNASGHTGLSKTLHLLCLGTSKDYHFL